MTCRSKVNHLYSVWITQWINKHYIFRLQISMNETQTFQLCQCRQNLLCDWANILERQRLKFVVLQEIVKVLLQHLKHEAGMILVLEKLESTHKVIRVSILLTKAAQDVDFNLALSSIWWVILQYLYCDNLTCASLPTLYHLTKSASAKELKNLVGTGWRVKNFMLHEMVVSLAVWRICVLRSRSVGCIFFTAGNYRAGILLILAGMTVSIVVILDHFLVSHADLARHMAGSYALPALWSPAIIYISLLQLTMHVPLWHLKTDTENKFGKPRYLESEYISNFWTSRPCMPDDWRAYVPLPCQLITNIVYAKYEYAELTLICWNLYAEKNIHLINSCDMPYMSTC